jgi:hypothetical protein
VRTGTEAGAEHKTVFMGVAASAEHEAALMDGRSTKLQPWAESRRGGRSCLHRRSEGIIIENGQAVGVGVHPDTASRRRALVSPSLKNVMCSTWAE